MGEYDTAAFTDRFMAEKRAHRLRISALRTVRARLKTQCLNYAIQIERQLQRQERGTAFLETVQNEVNNYFKSRSDDVYQKLQKASQLVSSKDAEDASLLLAEVRRASKALADFWYPPVNGTVSCADGRDRKLGEEQYLNRPQEFLSGKVATSTSKDVLQKEFDLLSAFIRRLNDMASKGVHAAVTLAEAKQGLVGLYLFTFNVCQHLTKSEGEG